MTLPYPHEIETGQLKPVDANDPDPLDVERRVRRMISVDGAFVDVAGRRLRTPDPESAQTKADQLRSTVSGRLLERRPNADEATWQKLRESLHEALSNHENLDQDAVNLVLLTVDGL
jgi:hypothetical protein